MYFSWSKVYNEDCFIVNEVFMSVNILNFLTLFSFCVQLNVEFKCLIRIANREYPDQTASLEAV